MSRFWKWAERTDIYPGVTTQTFVLAASTTEKAQIFEIRGIQYLAKACILRKDVLPNRSRILCRLKPVCRCVGTRIVSDPQLDFAWWWEQIECLEADSDTPEGSHLRGHGSEKSKRFCMSDRVVIDREDINLP